jgi:hypothetical protein
MMQAQGPDPENRIVQFTSADDLRAWVYAHVGEPEQFLADVEASEAELAAWRASGGQDWPSGWVPFRDFLREHPV